MPVSFRVVGALAATTTNSLNIVAGAGILANDILIAATLNRTGTPSISAPDGTWTSFADVDMSVSGFGTHFATLWWRRAPSSADAGATFTFTRTAGTATLFAGCIAAYPGCKTSGSPLDATAPSVHRQTSSDVNIFYDDFNPTETAAWVVAIGWYGNDIAAVNYTIAGTDPVLADNWALETNTGADGMIYGHSGASSGAATGARQQDGTDSAISISVGVLFGLIAAAGGLLEFDMTGGFQDLTGGLDG